MCRPIPPIAGRLGLALVLAGGLLVAAPADAGERIFSSGFEECCQIGGSTRGLTAAGLSLKLSAGSQNQTLAITRNGAWDFPQPVPPGTSYVVSINSQPNGQNCTLSNASGTTSQQNVEDVEVFCASGDALLWDTGTWGQNWQ